MRRRRYEPNSSIDLTSLLDVVFIMLFVVIIAYASKAKFNTTESEKTIQDLTVRNQELENEFDDAENKAEALQKELESCNNPESIGIRIVTVYCTYNVDDLNTIDNRHISIIGPDGEEIYHDDLTGDNESYRYNLVESKLKDYVLSHPDDLLVFTLNTDTIQRRDRLKIESIFDSLDTELNNNGYEIVFR